jgi:hypothetical protein
LLERGGAQEQFTAEQIRLDARFLKLGRTDRSRVDDIVRDTVVAAFERYARVSKRDVGL